MKTFIDHTMVYSITWLLAYVVGGIIWYIVDRQYLTGFFRRVYNLTHEVPLADAEVRGIIHGQKAARLFVWAALISTVQSVGLFFFTGFHSNPFVELVLWFLEIPAMVIGFYCGQLLFPLWQQRAKVYNTLDKLEERVQRGHSTKPAPAAGEPIQSAPSNIAPPISKPAEQVDDPKSLIGKFTRE